MDLIQRVCELRQSGNSAVVSEAGLTEIQNAMHVRDGIEDWIAERISRWQNSSREVPLLLVLSGNAGDGKSELIQRLRERLTETDDLRVVPDATHADTPNEDQVATLADFLSPFADSGSASASISLIAMNTGMALSFLEAVTEPSTAPEFATLAAVLKRELGVTFEDPPEEPTWEYEVVNLDRRSVISGDSPLIDGMFERLDPDNSEGVLGSMGEGCTLCPARDWCFVRTNLDLLTNPAVREQVKQQLLAASLSEQLHLTPRSVWDLLSQIVAGDIEFLTRGDAHYCEQIKAIATRNSPDPKTADVAAVHGRLIWHLLFERPPDAVEQRGPVLTALEEADPLSLNGRAAHEAASAVFAAPQNDADAMRDVTSPGVDPFLARLATLMGQPELWGDPELRRLAAGVSRRAVVTGRPNVIASEVQDLELDKFVRLLDAYGSWVGDEAPPEIFEFSDLLLVGIRSIFGLTVGAETYFRQDSFSPASRHPAYVRVSIEEQVYPAPDEDVVRGREWLRAVRYRPSTVGISIASGGRTAWSIRGDLPLFRLLCDVSAGYSASSLDLERFYGLRFACESLGSSQWAANELVILDTDSGARYRLVRRVQLGKEILEMVPAE